MSRAAFLKRLIDPRQLKARMRFWTMYDAIMCAAPELRVFEFHPTWRRNEQMAAFKNGSGDFFFAWFSSKGTVIRGFAHERRAPQNVFAGLPEACAYVLSEPAFAQDEVTFAFWNTGHGGWRCSSSLLPKPVRDADGAEELLGCLAPRFEAWRKEHYGTPKTAALAALAAQRAPLTRETVFALNPDADIRVVAEEAELTGWNVALTTTRPHSAPGKSKRTAR